MGFFLGVIVSFILNLFYSVFKFLARIVKDILIATKLIFPALCAIVGGILMLTGHVVYGEISFVYFALCMSMSFMLTIYLWYRSVTRKARRQQRRRSSADIPPRRRITRDRRDYRDYPRGAPVAQNRGKHNTQGPYYAGNTSQYHHNQHSMAHGYNTESLPITGYAQNTDAHLRDASPQYGGRMDYPQQSPHSQALLSPDDGFDTPQHMTGIQDFHPIVPLDSREINPYRRREPIPGKFFRVKQNPRFIMRELPDKVELYEETEQGLKFIRSDTIKHSE